MPQDPEDDDVVDFALAAWCDEGVWRVEEIDDDALVDLDSFVGELSRHPGDFGSLGMVVVDEDYFLLVRVAEDRTRVLLSDVTAATTWPLARSVVSSLGIPVPDDDDEQAPAGDLGIVADLGLAASDLGALLDDYDLYPDEVLGDIAHVLGYGAQYDDALAVPTA